MKRITIIIFWLLTLFFISGLFSCKKWESENTGGSCNYTHDPVTITIKKVEKETGRENNQSSRDPELLIITYEMTFEGGPRTGKIEDEIGVRPVEAKEKGVEVGKKFKASVSRLISETCNPEPRYPDFDAWK